MPNGLLTSVLVLYKQLIVSDAYRMGLISDAEYKKYLMEQMNIWGEFEKEYASAKSEGRIPIREDRQGLQEQGESRQAGTSH